jgi:chromate reductase
MRVLAISGSLRRDSNNTRLLRVLAEEAPARVQVALWEGLKDIPPFDQDAESTPQAAVQAFKDAVGAADAVLIATPEYNSSIPGALKNALDWASRPLAENPFRNKPVAVIASSSGMFGAVWAAAELRKVLGAMGARVADVELAVGHAHEKFGDDGALLEHEIRAGLVHALEALVATAVPDLAAV